MSDMTLPVIQGAKSGGNVTKDNIQSVAQARFVDMISEGEIVGLVDGAKSIYFNQTPLQNADGSYNFENVVWEQRKGLPDDSYLKGHGYVEQLTSVETEVTNSSGSVLRTIAQPNADAVRVIIRVNSLYKVDDDGNIGNNDLHYQIEMRPAGGAWRLVVDKQINNRKSSSPFQIGHRFNLPEGVTSWDVRVTRLSADENNEKSQSTMYWESYVTLVEGRFTYPNSAVIGMEVDAEDIGSSVPSRAFKVKGLKIAVPSNYNPETRVYTGVWNGTFKIAWTNNPVWVLYDLLTNNRYGLGEFIAESEIDKWGLYRIAQYCDQLVPSGEKTAAGADIMEPRYTFNGVISNREEAFFCLQKISAAFRGMGYWALGQFFATADMPEDPVQLVVPANVEGGAFTYSSTATKARHTVALVKWNDPSDFYRPAVELVIDEDALVKYGWREKQVDLLGCTSRGLANRYGRWMLDIENNETETIEYQAGLDHALVRPGNIIAVSDPRKAAVRYGGRIVTHFDPTKSIIKNKLKSSNDLTNANWGKANTTVTKVADNTFAVMETAVTGVHYIAQGVLNTGVNTITLELKPNGRNYAMLELRGQDLVYRTVTFDLITGAVLSKNTAFSVVSTQLQDGWWRFSVTLDYGSGSSSTNVALFTSNGSTTSFAGSTSAGLLVRYPQSEAGNSFTEYQQTSTSPIIILDQDVTLESGKTYKLYLTMPSGKLELLNVTSRPAAGQLVIASGTDVAMDGSVFMLVASNLEPKKYRVLSVNEVKENLFSVTALFHDPLKYGRVERGLKLSQPSYAIEQPPTPPTNLTVVQNAYIVDGAIRTKVNLSWTPPLGVVVRSYTVSVISSRGNMDPFGTTMMTNIEIPNLLAGTYTLKVVTTDRFGQNSSPAEITVDVVGSDGLTNLSVDTLFNLDDPGSGNFQGASPAISWTNLFKVASSVDASGYVNTSPLYKHNTVKVYDAATNTLLRTENVVGNSYRYDIEFNRTDSAAKGLGQPRRALRFDVTVADIKGRVSSVKSLGLTNPVPGVPSISFIPGPDNCVINWTANTDNDIRGYRLWVAKTASYDPMVAIPAYDGPNNSFVFTGDENTTYYAMIGAYDAFSKTDMLIGGPFSFGTTSYASIFAEAGIVSKPEVLGALPTTGNFEGRFVYLTTDKKLYRYDGTRWLSSVPVADLTGTLTNELFPSGLRPVEVVNALPTSGSDVGRVVFLTTNGKLYRFDGTQWTTSVASGDISGQLTDSQIASVSTSKLSGTISDTQIAAVSATKVTGTMSDAQIAALSAAKLTGQITTTQISDDAITSAKIAANAVTATEIAASAVTAGKIAANAVTSTEIAAKSITASKMLITPSAFALNDDPNTQDITAWSGGGLSIVTDTTSPVGATVLQCAAATTTVLSRQMPLDATRNYEYRIWTKQASGSSTTYLTVAFYDASGVALGSSTGGSAAGWPAIGSYHYFGLVNGVLPAAWTEYRISFGPNETAKIPTGAKYVRVGLLSNYNGTGVQWATGIRLMQKADAELIVDGSITSTKIAAGAVTAGKIAADSITSTEIAAEAITANELAAGAVTAGKIDAGAVTAGTIAAGAVTATELAAGSVTAGKIAAGAISATEIAADAVTASKIAANTITGDKIVANTLTSGLIAAGAIQTSHLAADSVTSSKIAAGSVTATEIAAGTITATQIAAGAITAAKMAANSITASNGAIADLAVSTLSIANRAVTFWRSTSGSGSPGSSWTTIASVTFTPSVDVGSLLILVGGTGSAQGSSSNTATCSMRVRWRGVVVVSRTVVSSDGNNIVTDNVAIIDVATAGTGSGTLEVQIDNTGAAGTVSASVDLSVLEFKK